MNEDQASRLLKLLAEGSRIVDRAAAVLQSIPADPGERYPDDLEDGKRAVARLRQRRYRDSLFPPNIFADPAWDILLDLFAAAEAKKKVCVSSACIAASVPATTALRWIGHLERQKLIIRVPDAEDGRRIYLELTEDTVRRMRQALRYTGP